MYTSKKKGSPDTQEAAQEPPSLFFSFSYFSFFFLPTSIQFLSARKPPSLCEEIKKKSSAIPW